MSTFTSFDTNLKLEYLKEYSRVQRKDYWKVLEEFKFYSDQFGQTYRIWIRVPVGFKTDGATVPRIFWSLIPPLGQYGQAAVLHDYLREVGLAYLDGEEYIGQPSKELRISIKESDEIFLEAMKVLGVSWLKRTTMYLAVRFFAKLKHGITE